MPIESKFTRVEADDPRRCQAATKFGQCPYKAMDGSQGCPLHSGPVQQNAAKRKEQRIYRLAQWQNRVGEIADHEQVKSLREELGILRLLMEQTMSMCHDSTSLMINSNKLSDLAIRIEKLVNSCHRLEQSTGLLLDKSTALNIGAQIVEIVSRYVTDEIALEQIGQGIVDSILRAHKDPKSGT